MSTTSVCMSLMPIDKVKRDFLKLVTHPLQQEDIYITQHGCPPWVVMQKYPKSDTPESLNVDYMLSVSELKALWQDVFMAIEAYHTVFVITSRGVPVAILKATEIPHPMRAYLTPMTQARA